MLPHALWCVDGELVLNLTDDKCCVNISIIIITVALDIWIIQQQ